MSAFWRAVCEYTPFFVSGLHGLQWHLTIHHSIYPHITFLLWFSYQKRHREGHDASGTVGSSCVWLEQLKIKVMPKHGFPVILSCCIILHDLWDLGITYSHTRNCPAFLYFPCVWHPVHIKVQTFHSTENSYHTRLAKNVSYNT